MGSAYRVVVLVGFLVGCVWNDKGMVDERSDMKCVWYSPELMSVRIDDKGCLQLEMVEGYLVGLGFTLLLHSWFG